MRPTMLMTMMIGLFLMALAVARCGDPNTGGDGLARGKPVKMVAFTLSWNYAVPALFKIYERAVGAFYDQAIASTTNLSITLEQPEDRQTYCFVVTAVIDGQESVHSEEACETMVRRG